MKVALHLLTRVRMCDDQACTIMRSGSKLRARDFEYGEFDALFAEHTAAHGLHFELEKL